MQEDPPAPPQKGLARWTAHMLQTLLSVLVIVLMLAIVLQVVSSALDVNPLAVFDGDHLLVGRAITLNSLLDFQWHLLVIIGLLPAGIVWLRDRHVRVDFLSANFSERTRVMIGLAGNIVFAGPFRAMIIPATVGFAQRAYRSGEDGTSGGLADLWLIKGVLFVGFCILAVALVIDTVKLVREILAWKS